MSLSKFTADLLRNGNVLVANEILPFYKDDELLTTELLQQFYKHDMVELPGLAPQFDNEAALWGIKLMYRSVQFIILRSESDEVINAHFNFYEKQLNAGVIYSADLSLRFLPDIFRFAQALAPEDILVKKLKQLASQWPLSSVGVELDNAIILNENVIVENLSMRTLYVDRIIEHKDYKRLKHLKIKEAVLAVLGNYKDEFWPNFDDALLLI